MLKPILSKKFKNYFLKYVSLFEEKLNEYGFKDPGPQPTPDMITKSTMFRRTSVETNESIQKRSAWEKQNAEWQIIVIYKQRLRDSIDALLKYT